MLSLTDVLDLFDESLYIGHILLVWIVILERIVHHDSFQFSIGAIFGRPAPPFTALFCNSVQRIHFKFLISLELPSNDGIDLPQPPSQDGVELILDIILRSLYQSVYLPGRKRESSAQRLPS